MLESAPWALGALELGSELWLLEGEARRARVLADRVLGVLGSAESYVLRARATLALGGRVDRALEDLAEAEALAPGWREVEVWRAWALHDRGDYAECRAALAELGADPGLARRWELAWLEGQCAFAESAWSEALAAYRRCAGALPAGSAYQAQVEQQIARCEAAVGARGDY